MFTVERLRNIINTFVYGVFSIILAIVVIRFILKFIGANQDSEFVRFWYDFSYNFVWFFDGIYRTIVAANGKSVVEIFTIVALVVYVMLTYLVQRVLTAAVEATNVQIIINIVDTLFKVAEFLLISRFVLKLFAASTSSYFVRTIYSLSSIVYEPFQGIMPPYGVPSLNVVFETSTLIAIIVIIIFDIITEGIITSLLRYKSKTVTVVKTPTVENNLVTAAPSPVQPQHNITINLPQQTAPAQTPPQYVDNRTVQVLRPAYPGVGDNQLESRPIQPKGLPVHSQVVVEPRNNPVQAPRSHQN